LEINQGYYQPCHALPLVSPQGTERLPQNKILRNFIHRIYYTRSVHTCRFGVNSNKNNKHFIRRGTCFHV